MALIHRPVERDAAFKAWELVVFYQQDVPLHRVEDEFLDVDFKGREVSEIVDVDLFACYKENKRSSAGKKHNLCS